MGEAIHLPSFCPFPICFEHGFQPIVLSALALRKFESPLDTVLVLLPEHLEDPLLRLAEALSVRVCEEGRRTYWRKLPQVAREDDIDASKRSSVSAGLGMGMPLTSAPQGSIQLGKERHGNSTALIDDQPADTQCISEEIIEKLCEGTYLLGDVNIGAESEEELFFKNIDEIVETSIEL